MSEFTFGNVSGPVNAGSGNMNVGSGSQTVAGGDMHIGHRIGADPAMAVEIASMRQQLADLRLSSSERATAEEQLDALENADDKEAAAGQLESLVAGVKKADALASAGSSFIESAARIAKWLGPVAVGVLSLL